MEDKIKEYVDTDEVPQDNVDSKNEGGGGITLRGSKKNGQPVWPAVLIGIAVVLITVILVLVFNF